MERRDFIRLSMVGVGASVIIPAQTLAENIKQVAVKGDIYYTKDEPGRWSGKVATHLPSMEVTKEGGKVAVKVVTAHEMKGYEHYIVKHVLLDENYKFIDEHLFNPQEDKVAISSFALENYKGTTVHALSLCNKHDLWLSSAEI